MIKARQVIKAEQQGIASGRTARENLGEVAFEWGLNPGYHPELGNPGPLEGK